MLTSQYANWERHVDLNLDRLDGTVIDDHTLADLEICVFERIEGVEGRVEPGLILMNRNDHRNEPFSSRPFPLESSWVNEPRGQHSLESVIAGSAARKLCSRNNCILKRPGRRPDSPQTRRKSPEELARNMKRAVVEYDCCR